MTRTRVTISDKNTYGKNQLTKGGRHVATHCGGDQTTRKGSLWIDEGQVSYASYAPREARALKPQRIMKQNKLASVCPCHVHQEYCS